MLSRLSARGGLHGLAKQLADIRLGAHYAALAAANLLLSAHGYAALGAKL